MATSYLFNLFGHSPIKPLQEQMNIVHSCVETLPLFLEAILKNNWEEAEKYQKQIADLEREADELKRSLRLSLPKSLFMPVSRVDVLELLSTQDAIANKARDIAGLILGRKMQFPDIIAERVMQLYKRSVDASLQTKKAIQELEAVFESGFRGGEIETVQNIIKELDHIEQDTDNLQIEIRKDLFRIEKTLPPVDVIFIYKAIEWGAELADRAHRVGGRLSMLLAG